MGALWQQWSTLMTETGFGMTFPLIGFIVMGVYAIRKATK